MTRSNPLKGKYERYDEVMEDDNLEGTSARTRPFSFDDIMLARSNKADVTKQVLNGSGVMDIALAQNGKIFYRECHKKTNEDSNTMDNRHILEDLQKSIFLGKGDTRAYRENRILAPDKDKRPQEHYPKLKSVVNKNISNDRETEVKHGRHSHYNKEKHVGEKDSLLGDGSDNGSDSNQSRGSVKKKKGSETRKGKSEMDKDRHVSRKSKTHGHATNDSGYKNRNKREMMLADKVRHKYHKEEDKTRGRSTGEKHTLEKEVESTLTYHGESRSKRRHSPSTDHAKERGSKSPKVHKHRSSDKREHGDLSSNSTKDRPGKENSDVDKRISSNGSSNQYRGNNASSSGLGGYSPRKRKTDAAAKTPSPTHRSPARRTAGWDLQPLQKESAIAGSTFSGLHPGQNLSMNIHESPSSIPVAPIVMKPIGISPRSLSSQMHAIETIQLTQSTRPMRRLYVENLPASASEKDLIECINKFLLSSGVDYIQGTQPCISCIIHKEKSQARLEFLTPEDASTALSFDGISFSGSHLMFRRPKDYSTITTGVPDKSVAAVDSVSDNVEDSPYKIFVGGISKFISSKMLLEIAGVFGPVRAFRYEHIADIKEPCAFLEACAGLNGMKLGGKVVTAVFATPDAAVISEDVGKLPFYGVPVHAKPLLEMPLAVLQLKNALDLQDIMSLSESELEKILEDIRIECSRFGTVKSINVAKPTNSPGAEEAETKTTNASINGCNLMSESTCETAKLGETINEVTVLDQSGPAENTLAAEPDVVRSKVGGECDCLLHEIKGNNLVKDETWKPSSDDADISMKDCQQISSIDEVESDNAAAGSISQRNVETQEKAGASLELDTCERRELGPHEAVHDTQNDPGNLFEPGCVFVEYRRAEAACMAAHCLQGRLFDGHVVTVGYVSRDLYQMRFHK